MKFLPLGDRVAIEPESQNDTTLGGIIIPDTSKSKPSKGIIVAVGNGARNQNGDIIPMQLSVGDKIMFGQWSGSEMDIDGRKYLIMKESDVIGVIIND